MQLKLKLSRPSWKKKLVLFWKFENLLHFWFPTFKFEVFAAKQFFWCNSFGPESHYDVLAASCTMKCRFVSLALSEVRVASIEVIWGKFFSCPQSSDSTSRIIIECLGWQKYIKINGNGLSRSIPSGCPGFKPLTNTKPQNSPKMNNKILLKNFHSSTSSILEREFECLNHSWGRWMRLLAIRWSGHNAIYALFWLQLRLSGMSGDLTFVRKQLVRTSHLVSPKNKLPSSSRSTSHG